MAVWVAEADVPEDWMYHAISPIIYDGGWIVYVGGYNVQKFYKYNLDTDTWTELMVPPGVLQGGLAISPDESKLAARLLNTLLIYDISSPGWTTSSTAPVIPGCNATQIFGICWAEADTIWCQCRGFDPGISDFRVKFMKYTVSTNSWTQYTTVYTPTFSNSSCLCISTDGTKLYAGNCGAGYYSTTVYLIATDTYAAGPDIFSAHYFVSSADRHKLWWGPRRTTPATHYTITRWINPDTGVLEAGVFPEKADAETEAPLSAGVYGLTMAIAAQKKTNPKLWSYIEVALPTVTTNSATSVAATSAVLNGKLDNDGGAACNCGFEWGETTGYGNTTPPQSRRTGQTFAQTISGLDPKKTYHFRALATNSAGTEQGDDRTFTTLAVAPTVATNPAIDINNDSATLKGKLTYDGGEACNCSFEYGETEAYGTTTPTQSKESGEAFSQPIASLDANKTYHFRAIATNSAETSHGADRTFKTLVSAPAVTTKPATGLGAVLATLNGTLNNDIGEACECGFEWGLDTDYGITTPTESKITDEDFSQVIGGLIPNTVYHFRALATNSFGTGHGDDMSFTTALVISRAFALARSEL